MDDVSAQLAKKHYEEAVEEFGPAVGFYLMAARIEVTKAFMVIPDPEDRQKLLGMFHQQMQSLVGIPSI